MEENTYRKNLLMAEHAIIMKDTDQMIWLLELLLSNCPQEIAPAVLSQIGGKVHVDGASLPDLINAIGTAFYMAKGE